jgi:hypothetical protein
MCTVICLGNNLTFYMCGCSAVCGRGRCRRVSHDWPSDEYRSDASVDSGRVRGTDGGGDLPMGHEKE